MSAGFVDFSRAAISSFSLARSFSSMPTCSLMDLFMPLNGSDMLSNSSGMRPICFSSLSTSVESTSTLIKTFSTMRQIYILFALYAFKCVPLHHSINKNILIINALDFSGAFLCITY